MCDYLQFNAVNQQYLPTNYKKNRRVTVWKSYTVYNIYQYRFIVYLKD